jgi:arylsulfatase A-like enzyme
MTTSSPDNPGAPESASAEVGRGLSQWPLVAAAWALHGGLLLWVFFGRFPSDKLALAERLLVPIGLVAMIVLEVGVVTLLCALPEVVRPRGRLALALDLVKSLVLSVTVTTLVASTLKFLGTSVHLKFTDLWFGYTNARQILQEAQVAEALAILALPFGCLVLAALLLFGFRRWRSRGRGSTGRRFGIVMAACLAALVLTGSLSLLLPQVVKSISPEGHWAALRRSHARFMGASAGIGTLPEGAGARLIAPYAPERTERPLNVVLVMLESVPWKRTFLNDESRQGVTPNLEGLASESIIFDRAYAASTHSDYAQMAILSSLHPRKYNRHDYYVDIDYPRALIWDALKPAGYTTGLFSCQNERWGNMLNFLETPGLDVLRHSLHWPKAPRKGRGMESKVYEATPVAEWQRWRRERVDGPYFAYLNFQSNHFPYEVPPEAPRPYQPEAIDFAASFLRYPKSGIPVMLNRFDNALHYADHYIGEVVSFLKEIGDWDSTVLVVVSDHGEAFYEHEQPTHGTSLYEEQVRSLLMIRVPGLPGRRIEEPISLLDVPPTLLEILGLEPHGNFQGRGDVLEADYDGDERPFFFTIQGLTLEDGVLLEGTKLIVNFDRQTKQLYDLRSDPEELSDVAAERPDRLHALEQVLGAFLRQQLTYYEEQLWLQGFYPAPLP